MLAMSRRSAKSHFVDTPAEIHTRDADSQACGSEAICLGYVRQAWTSAPAAEVGLALNLLIELSPITSPVKLLAEGRPDMVDNDIYSKQNSYNGGRYLGHYDGTQESYLGILEKENAEASSRANEVRPRRRQARVPDGPQPLKALFLVIAAWCAALYFGAPLAIVLQVTLAIGGVILGILLVGLIFSMIAAAIRCVLEWFFGLFIVKLVIFAGIGYAAVSVLNEFV